MCIIKVIKRIHVISYFSYFYTCSLTDFLSTYYKKIVSGGGATKMARGRYNLCPQGIVVLVGVSHKQ